MAFSRINQSGDVQRKYFACAIDVSDNGTPEYVVIGYKISESALEINPEVEQGTDINGRNYASVDKVEPTQSFDPHRLTGGELGKLGEKMLHYLRERDLAKFSEFKCILIYGFLGSEGAYEADHYDACTVMPQSLGGESWTEMPFDITFGGEVKAGTVDDIIGTVEFTEGSP